MLLKLPMYNLAVFVLASATAENVKSQADVEFTDCSDYINGTTGNAPFANVIQVKNGTRLTFWCRDCGCEENLYCWYTGDFHVTYLSETDVIHKFNISYMEQEPCLNRFEMTISFADVPYSSTIRCTTSDDSSDTHPICSRNVTANHIMVIIIEDDSPEPSSCTCTPCPECEQCPIVNPLILNTLELLQLNISNQLAKFNVCLSSHTNESMQRSINETIPECEWKWLLGAQFLTILVELIIGGFILTICCKLQKERTISCKCNQPIVQFRNPTDETTDFATNSGSQT